MSPLKHKLLSVQLWIAICLLFVPAALSFVNFSVKEVRGNHFDTPPGLTASGWFSGSFQKDGDNYLQKRHGLYDFIVRAYNELDFRLFKKAHARFVVIGREKYLYESGYIESYYGTDLLSHAKIESRTRLIKLLQDAMMAEGKLLLPVIAPGKASFYPDHFPARYQRGQEKKNNYQAFVTAFEKENIRYLDFRKHFLSWKNTSPYPLYPRSGIHWSNYASTLCMDSIASFCGQALQTTMPRMIVDSVRWSEEVKQPDNDIAEGLNLFTDLSDERMAYPYFHFEKSEEKKLTLLTVADSFWWYIYSQGLPSAYFKNHSFWYYNEEMYPSSGEQNRVRSADYFSRIRQSDVILLLYNESNLHRFPDGFLEMAKDVFITRNPALEQLQHMKAVVADDKKWFKQIEEKAAARNITIDSMLTLDAMYLLKQNKKPRQ